VSERQHDHTHLGAWFCDHWSHASEARFESIPFVLARCRVCMALMESDGHAAHLEWHMSSGTLHPRGGNR